MNDTVSAYIEKHKKWTQELQLLRSFLLELDLIETVKWGAPTYVYRNKNVVGIAAFKNYFGMWFFQGGLLKDDANLLMNAQEGKTKAMRQWRFNAIEEVDKETIQVYVLEAMKNVELGNEIKPTRTKKPLIIPDELTKVFNENEKLKFQFDNLSLTARREFAEYISEAKREATKIKRLEKIIPMIQSGIGLNDKYKKK